MKRKSLWMVILCALLAVAACATRQQSGAVAGGGVGALAGSAITDSPVGAVVGGLVGAFIGSEVGRYMDEQDRRRAMLVLENTPTNQTRQWVNPDTGASYQVTPTQTFRERTGKPCREFRMRADVGQRVEEVYGTACRQPDGSWRVVDSQGI